MDQVDAKTHTPFVVGLMALYSTVGLLISAVLLWTLVEHPPSADAVEDPDWANAWTGAFLADSYALAICLCGIICMTEPGLSASMWTVLQLVLGPLLTCFYMVHSFRWYGGFRLRSKRNIYQRPLGLSGPNWRATMTFCYVIVALAFTLRVGWNQVKFPLFPLETEDVDWATEWLFTSMIAFYSMALCFLGFVWSSQGLWANILWSGAILLIGSPACCVYVGYRLRKYETLALSLFNNGHTPYAAPPSSKAVINLRSETEVADASSKNSSRSPSKQSSAGGQDPKSKTRASTRSTSKEFGKTQSTKSQTPSNTPPKAFDQMQSTKSFGMTMSNGRQASPRSKTPEGNGEARITSRVLIHARRPEEGVEEDPREEEEIMHAI